MKLRHPMSDRPHEENVLKEVLARSIYPQTQFLGCDGWWLGSGHEEYALPRASEMPMIVVTSVSATKAGMNGFDKAGWVGAIIANAKTVQMRSGVTG